MCANQGPPTITPTQRGPLAAREVSTGQSTLHCHSHKLESMKNPINTAIQATRWTWRVPRAPTRHCHSRKKLGNSIAFNLGSEMDKEQTLTMSGCAVIICSAGASCALPLYFKSPMALDRFKLPFTLHTTIGPVTSQACKAIPNDARCDTGAQLQLFKPTELNIHS